MWRGLELELWLRKQQVGEGPGVQEGCPELPPLPQVAPEKVWGQGPTD